MSEISFARQQWLALLFVPFFAMILRRLLQRRRSRQWASLGVPSTLDRFVTGSTRSSRWRIAILTLAWWTGAFAVAGPRWGTEAIPGVAVGRDFVLVLDFSRSMWAEDMQDAKHPARWQAAIASARRPVLESKARGGDRIALVVFAAESQTIAPLTTDYDHLLLRLESLDARAPPAEIVPAKDDAPSGTRIGAALQAAVKLHDDRFSGFQEIVLFTDADDPANDGEWRRGVSAARAAKIPVHVVPLGDPNRDSLILVNGEPLEGPSAEGVRSPIQTRLHLNVAKAIAEESHGELLSPDTGDFARRMALNSAREIDDEQRPQPREHTALFAAFTMLLLLCVWLR